MSIRAIPGSTSTWPSRRRHHGHAFGSLVLIDLRCEDDGACSQIDPADARRAVPRVRGRAGPARQGATARPGR